VSDNKTEQPVQVTAVDPGTGGLNFVVADLDKDKVAPHTIVVDGKRICGKPFLDGMTLLEELDKNATVVKHPVSEQYTTLHTGKHKRT
jgi:hypothetical protein